MLAAGSLRNQIDIQQQAAGQDAAGQPLDGWTSFATVWADVRHQSGLEAIKGDAPVSTVKASMRIRWREGVKAGMRVLYAGRFYNINGVLPDARREYVDLATEVSQ